MQSRIDVSIIIVHYKVKKEILACIKSIIDSTSRLNYEIIVVDNDEDKSLQPTLKRKYPKVHYINNPINNGWGGGVNVGVKVAKGKYLYLLNPDTILSKNALNKCVDYALNNSKVAVIASRLVDTKGHPFIPLGSMELTPAWSLVSNTALGNIYPFTKLKDRFFKGTQDEIVTHVQIPPLTASLIQKSIFKRVGQLDEGFFLYFEEYDFGRRLRKLGYNSVIIDDSQVTHAVGSSTKKINDSNSYFKKSRRYYFKKHFGVIPAYLLERIFKVRRK